MDHYTINWLAVITNNFAIIIFEIAITMLDLILDLLKL